jgi:hypothetical protein
MRFNQGAAEGDLEGSGYRLALGEKSAPLQDTLSGRGVPEEQDTGGCCIDQKKHPDQSMSSLNFIIRGRILAVARYM